MLLVSTAGEDGVSWLGHAVEAGCGGAQVVGWVTFSTCVEYTSAREFEADEGRHRVPADSPYAWRQGGAPGTESDGWGWGTLKAVS